MKKFRDPYTYIDHMYHRLTGFWPVTKEKYGTTRYEMEYLWVKSPKHVLLMSKLIFKALKKWPETSPEDLAEDWVFGLNWDTDNPKIQYYIGYLHGAIDYGNRSNTNIPEF